ncbi:hypothetical protein GZH53_13230 [Flavihumibacter sp. R14]|nr:hypothetical protein [Flavihumibacter soli]
MNIIEQQVWDYLDGTCNGQEHKKIGHLIETDEAYRTTYSELKSLHLDLSGIELDEPSMGFTRNVMDKVAASPMPGSIRSSVDKRIIYSIAAFFAVALLVLLTAIFSQVEWTQAAGTALPEYEIPKVDYLSFMDDAFLRVFLFADLILGLYFFDSVIRKRMLSNSR